MKLRNQKRLDNVPKLKPFADADRVRIRHRGLPSRLFDRFHELKRMREEKSEASVAERTIRLGDKKSAASLSLLFPGLGQVYMGQRAFGLSFIISNVLLSLLYLFLSGILRISVFSSSLIPSYDYHVLLITPLAIALLSGISIHMAFGLFPELQLARLITANRKNRLYWLAIIFPGYGQLLNGQPKKGIAFSSFFILGVFSAVAIFFTYSVNWYEYIEELGVAYVETSLVIMSVFLAAGIAAYLLSLFDAVVVKRHPYLKRPLLKRIGKFLGIGVSPNDRTPVRKTSLKFAFISVAFILVLGLQLLRPGYRAYYSYHLENTREVFQKKHMTIIPAMLSNVRVPDSIKKIERSFRDFLS